MSLKAKAAHVLILALFAAASQAADSPSPAPKPDDKDKKLEAARAAIAKQDFVGAQGLLKATLAANPASADAHNLYAYSLRKAGTQQMDLVFKHYNEALRLDAKHLGTHEYLGEAYLLVGNLAKAREHLKLLDGLCGTGCKEYGELKQAITAYEGKSGPALVR